MEFRIISTKDNPAVKWLWGYCFENYEPFFSWYFKKYYKTENTLGAFENDMLLSCLQLIPYDIYLRNQLIPTSYIVGLSSYPEARRGGTIKRLLQASLEEMRNRNHPVSLLMPFKAGFYYPFEWEICYHHYKYIVPLEDLRSVAKPYGIIKRVEETEEFDDLNQCYQAFVTNKHGYVIRTPRNWQLLLEEHMGEKGFIYLLKNNNIPEGYVMYYLKENKLIVREMAYTNIKAQKSLFQFLYNHRSQVETLEWNAPFDDNTHFFLPDPKKGITLYPFLTARIVDVQKALSLISYPEDVEAKLFINVLDELAPWNNQTFCLHIKKQFAKVFPITQKFSIQISIGGLTQLLFGRLRASDLIYQGKLTATTEEVETLDKIFPICNNFINEYY